VCMRLSVHHAAKAGAVAIIVLAVLPWGDFQGHTHWSRVGWIPFVSPPVRLSDIIANLLLFAPLGAATAADGRPRPVLRAAITAGCLSFIGESTQLYSHMRFPSATDLVCNVAGAMMGAVMVCQRDTARVLWSAGSNNS
jgi:glycopeptide antibiotics resistance protein